MSIEPANPYAVEGHDLFDTARGEFAVEEDRIICGPLLKLPRVCLQTCETQDLTEFGTVIFARPMWFWKVQAVTGVIAAVLIALYFYRIFQLDTVLLSSSYRNVLLFGPCCLLLLVRSPSVMFKPPIQLNGYLARRCQRKWLATVLLSAVTSLPFVIVFVGLVIGSGPSSLSAILSSRSWWPAILLVGSIAAGRVLRGLLERHWETTRTRGLILKATPVGNGLFAVSGFTREFLAALKIRA